MQVGVPSVLGAGGGPGLTDVGVRSPGAQTHCPVARVDVRPRAGESGRVPVSWLGSWHAPYAVSHTPTPAQLLPGHMAPTGTLCFRWGPAVGLAGGGQSAAGATPSQARRGRWRQRKWLWAVPGLLPWH